jgi:hypothetical protein
MVILGCIPMETKLAVDQQTITDFWIPNKNELRPACKAAFDEMNILRWGQ